LLHRASFTVTFPGIVTLKVVHVFHAEWAEHMNRYKEYKNMTEHFKLSGRQGYINRETGELIDAEVVELKQGDADFQKIWVAQILAAAEELSSSRLKLVMYLVAESSKNQNMIDVTIRDLASLLKMSPTTVTKTLKTLEKKNIITRRRGFIFVNPDIVYKGTHHKRMNILFRYERIRAPLTPKQEQKLLEDNIDALDKHRKQLQKRRQELIKTGSDSPDRPVQKSSI